MENEQQHTHTQLRWVWWMWKWGADGMEGRGGGAEEGEWGVVECVHTPIASEVAIGWATWMPGGHG